MINEDLREHIKNNYDGAVLFDNPSFDNSIIGISTNNNIIYDLTSMVDELAEDDDMSYEEALEFIDYNTLRTIPYINEGSKPIVMTELL